MSDFQLDQKKWYKNIMAILVIVGGLIAGILGVKQIFPPRSPTLVRYNTEILLDRSDAMSEPFGEQTKLEAAVNAIGNEYLLGAESDNLALRMFGGACEGNNTKLAVKFGQNNQNKIKKALRKITTFGQKTPLVRAVIDATGDFNDLKRFGNPEQMKKIIVLIGGGDTCMAAPEKRLESRLKKSNIQVDFRYFGLGLSKTKQAMLEKIAVVTGGQVEAIDSPEELKEKLRRERRYGKLSLVAKDALGKPIAPHVSIRLAGETEEFADTYGDRSIDLPPGRYDVVFDYPPDIVHRGVVVSRGQLMTVEAGGYGRLSLVAKDTLGKPIDPRVSIRLAGEKEFIYYTFGGHSIDLPPECYDVVFDHMPDIVHREVVVSRGQVTTVEAGEYGRLSLVAKDTLGKPINLRVSIRLAGEKEEFTSTFSGRSINLPPGRYDVVFDYTPDIVHRGVVVSRGQLMTVEAGGYGRLSLVAKDTLGKPIDPRVSIRLAGEKEFIYYTPGGHSIDLPPGRYDLLFNINDGVWRRGVVVRKGAVTTVQVQSN